MKNILTALTCLLLLLSYGCGDEDNCANLDCGPNGNCDPDTGTCLCEEGFSGANCEINICDAIDCGPNGSCNPTDGSCLCDAGYEGAACDTEVRSNFLGSYVGDILPCVPGLLLSFIPEDLQEGLMMTPLDVTANSSDVVLVDIGAINSMVLGLAVTADVTATEFIIDEFSQELDVAGLTIGITGDGTGSFIDNNTMQLNLALDFVTPIGALNNDCEVIFTKQ